MDRRDTIKSILLGSVAGGLVINGCKTETSEPDTNEGNDSGSDSDGGGYGRVPEEIARNKALMAERFFTEHELATVAVLCDIILPADENSGSATDAEVPDFIEFIAKDMTYHQVPLRGGLMWLDHESHKRFDKAFVDLSDPQQIEIVDDIAYPDQVKPEHAQGAKFFSKMRDLTLTGFYTTKIGIDDLGFMGNTPNDWDGVPDEVLKKHGVSYDPKYQYVDHTTKAKLAEWDEKGNIVG